jgi:hypothetical protein
MSASPSARWSEQPRERHLPHILNRYRRRLVEPRYSMTTYTVLLLVALALLALRGFTTATGAVGGGILLWGASLDLAYVRRRKPERLRAHRVELDHVVRWQLLAIGVGGVALAVALSATGFAPLDHVGRLVKALIIGLTAAVGTIYASSLVDWYWILPKVSGVLGPAPCEAPGQERWAGVTNVWLFHRAVATFTVMGVLAGVPAYMAGTSHSGSLTVVWAFVSLTLTVAYSRLNEGVLTAFSHALNAVIEVGDTVRVREDLEDAQLTDAYVVDMSVQGLKYVTLPPAQPPRFTLKGVLLRWSVADKVRRVPAQHPPCLDPDHCQAVNWYCHRNPRAHGRIKADAETGAAPIA